MGFGFPFSVSLSLFLFSSLYSSSTKHGKTLYMSIFSHAASLYPALETTHHPAALSLSCAGNIHLWLWRLVLSSLCSMMSVISSMIFCTLICERSVILSMIFCTLILFCFIGLILWFLLCGYFIYGDFEVLI